MSTDIAGCHDSDFCCGKSKELGQSGLLRNPDVPIAWCQLRDSSSTCQ